ncbi:MAG: benzoylsuccinyl-CoA thiolase [Mycobacterium sp.]|uniref:benzoylsuccinyl-CoA thiolase n=1 Tax=Mycobacterium sp. TaxID=1785 RepID=UPI003C5E1A75
MSDELAPAVGGLFVTDPVPALIGGLRSTGSYVFPKTALSGDPRAIDDAVSEVLLSRQGRLWSWTDSRACPPPPFISKDAQFEPIGIVAVELDKEQMIVLGQLSDHNLIPLLYVGQLMELTLALVGSQDGTPRSTWAWAPVVEPANQAEAG